MRIPAQRLLARHRSCLCAVFGRAEPRFEVVGLRRWSKVESHLLVVLRSDLFGHSTALLQPTETKALSLLSPCDEASTPAWVRKPDLLSGAQANQQNVCDRRAGTRIRHDT
jgi:hypothetical protein